MTSYFVPRSCVRHEIMIIISKELDNNNIQEWNFHLTYKHETSFPVWYTDKDIIKLG